MTQDGPRLRKLKEVYKKAVQEILKEEEAIRMSIVASETKDSFYSDSSVQIKQDDIRKIFSDIKQQFSEVLKEKIRGVNLDLKLNTLDKDIKDGRVCYQDIRNPEYIREIFESRIADKKEELVRALETRMQASTDEIQGLESGIAETRERLRDMEAENAGLEREYSRIVQEMEMSCND